MDIHTGKEIWHGEIKQLYIEHSEYSNSLYVRLFDTQIVIAGDEAGGDYIQVIDINTGANIFTKIDSPYIDEIEAQRDSSELVLNADIYSTDSHDCFNISYDCKINEVIKGQITDTLIRLVLDVENFNKWEKLLPSNNFAVPPRLELGFIRAEKNDTCINGFIDKNKNNWKIKYLKSQMY